MHISALLQQRQLPPLQDAATMKTLLLQREYGILPEIPYTVTASEPEVVTAGYCGATVTQSRVQLTVQTQYGTHTFPVQQMLHTDGQPRPVVIFLNFRPNVPDRIYPAEELADLGVEVISACYADITSDDGDFGTGIAPLFLPNGQEQADSAGKIRLWAWAASRMLDYALSLPGIDPAQTAVVGHSRLGKTALVASMLDTRFRYAYSSCSGCSGAALSRGGLGQTGAKGIYGSTGESVDFITHRFPFWFCKQYLTYAEANMPEDFDQHWLLAAISPRFVYVGSGETDEWADPTSEFLGCAAASPAYEVLGLPGLVCAGQLPEVGEQFHEGRIGYHRAPGGHFLSRHDWGKFLAFMKRHEHDII